MLCDYGCGQEGKYYFKTVNKWCCNKAYAKCPAIRKKNSIGAKKAYINNARINPSIYKIKCIYCNKKISLSNIKRHEKSCKFNPDILRLCPVCNEPVRKGCTTCSRKCRLVYFGAPNKNGNNGKKASYRSICFNHHPYRCIICGENNIVAVHHYDENKDNDDPSNLVPLCPTHHIYIHSKFKYLILDIIERFILTQYKYMWE